VFADLDVLAVGPVVNQVADDFERYWTSGSSYPLDKVLPMADDTRSDDVMTSAVGAQRNPEAITYVDAIRNSAFARDWNERHLILLWASARIVSDDSAKGLGQVASEALHLKTLREIIDQSSEQVMSSHLISFPRAPGADALIASVETWRESESADELSGGDRRRGRSRRICEMARGATRERVVPCTETLLLEV
jgi:putative cardiolipin synthase